MTERTYPINLLLFVAGTITAILLGLYDTFANGERFLTGLAMTGGVVIGTVFGLWFASTHKVQQTAFQVEFLVRAAIAFFAVAMVGGLLFIFTDWAPASAEKAVFIGLAAVAIIGMLNIFAVISRCAKNMRLGLKQQHDDEGGETLKFVAASGD